MILKSIIDLQTANHIRLLEMRKLDRVLNSYSFIEAWKNFNKKQKLATIKLIKRVKVEQIKKIIEKHDLENMSVIGLRRTASCLHIKNYSRKSKLSLIQEIDDARRRHENKHREIIKNNDSNISGSKDSSVSNKDEIR